MSGTGSSGGGWLDRLVGSCVSVLLAAVALYCAVHLIASVLPTLLVIVGVLALLALGVVVVLAIRAWRGRY